jgi:hypothetical protein
MEYLRFRPLICRRRNLRLSSVKPEAIDDWIDQRSGVESLRRDPLALREKGKFGREPFTPFSGRKYDLDHFFNRSE